MRTSAGRRGQGANEEQTGWLQAMRSMRCHALCRALLFGPATKPCNTGFEKVPRLALCAEAARRGNMSRCRKGGEKVVAVPASFSHPDPDADPIGNCTEASA